MKNKRLRYKAGYRVMLCVAVSVMLCAVFGGAAFAASDDPVMHRIDITVQLNGDGSATFTEIWDVTVNSGTEWYLPKYNLKNQDIQDVAVTDENGVVFENIGDWDVNKSISEKAGKCGLVSTNGGYEICWGIGSLGSHVFTLTYTMTNIVQRYSDADVIYQYFVSQIGGTAEDVRLVIREPEAMELTADNTRVWAFGMPGEIYVVEGGVVFQSDGSTIPYDSYLSVLIGFDPGMFMPAVSNSESFDDIKNDALTGSDYNDNYDQGSSGGSTLSDFFSSAATVSIIVIPFLAPVLSLIINGRKRKEIRRGKLTRREYEELPYCRDIPFEGSLPAAFDRLDKTDGLVNKGAVIGAYLLRWMRKNQISLVQQGDPAQRIEPVILFYVPHADMTPLERQLYDMLATAAGADGLLQSKEFEKWCNAHYNKIHSWFSMCEREGTSVLKNMGVVVPKSTYHVATDYGVQMIHQMYGFKKYLENFTIINERTAAEVALWDEYLVFAQLFGIADRVASQFRELYPSYFTDFQAGFGNGTDMHDIVAAIYISNMFARAGYSGYHRGQSAYEARSSGGGGSSSFGGGGGASGGGGGGGHSGSR